MRFLKPYGFLEGAWCRLPIEEHVARGWWTALFPGRVLENTLADDELCLTRSEGSSALRLLKNSFRRPALLGSAIGLTASSFLLRNLVCRFIKGDRVSTVLLRDKVTWKSCG